MTTVAEHSTDPVLSGITTLEHENLGLVVQMLARLDVLRGEGHSLDELAERMAAEFAEPPGGGEWSPATVARVLQIVASVRSERTEPAPQAAGSAPVPTPGHRAMAMIDAPGPTDPTGPTGPAPDDPERRSGLAWGRLGLGALVVLALGAAGYGALQLRDGEAAGPTTSAPAADRTGADEAGADGSDTAAASDGAEAGGDEAGGDEPDPADMMAIRIEPDPEPEAGAEAGSAADEGTASAPASATIRDDGLLHLEGAFPTQDDADVFIANAAAVFGRDNIVESYVIDDAAPDPTVSDVALDKPVLFESGTATIDPSYIPFLEACGDVLKLNAHITMSISAFTDSTGSEEFNLDLSRRRAQAIVDFYRDFEVDDAQLVGVGYGESAAFDDNATPEGRAQNRRAMLTLLGAVSDPDAS